MKELIGHILLFTCTWVFTNKCIEIDESCGQFDLSLTDCIYLLSAFIIGLVVLVVCFIL
jgi:hypothetical protein